MEPGLHGAGQRPEKRTDPSEWPAAWETRRPLPSPQGVRAVRPLPGLETAGSGRRGCSFYRKKKFTEQGDPKMMPGEDEKEMK